MAVAKAQLPIEGLKTQAEAAAEEAEADAKREARNVLRVRLMSALRMFAKGQVAECAKELDADLEVFNKESDDTAGKAGVSESLLRACLSNSNRNYFRLDWIFWFLEECQEARDVMLEACGSGRPAKDKDQYIRDLEEQFHEELSQTRAKRAIQRARLK